jgi:hypothetical protein
MFEAQSPPLSEQEWGTAGGTSSGRRRDPDTRYDQRIGAPRQFSIQSPYPSYPSSRTDDWQASNRPPMSRRMARTVTRFLVAVLIGVGATLAWQSYGDAAREMVADRLPALAWLLSVPAAKAPGVAATSPDAAQQLEPLASNLDDVRRSVQQLAAKQDQMAQNITVLRAIGEDIREKMSSTPPSPVEQTASGPQPRPQQPRTQPAPVPRAAPPAAPPAR